MVFSPDAGGDVLLGQAAPATHHYDEDELIGGGTQTSNENVINEDLDSLDDLLSRVVRHESEMDNN
jgi:DNA-directed RNA polymerase subunit beta'